MPLTPEELTPENIAVFLEEARAKYTAHSLSIVQTNLQKVLIDFALIPELMHAEIEAGSKELAVHRELHFLVSKSALTAENWNSINNRLAALQEERKKSLEAAREQVAASTTTDS